MEDDFEVMFYLIDTLFFYIDKYFSKCDKLVKLEKKKEIELGNLYTIYEEEEEEEEESLSKTLLDNLVDDFLLV